MALITLKEMLHDAYANNYCIGMFDAMDFNMAKEIVAAAEELNAPVMLATAQVLLQYEKLEPLADCFLMLAKKAKVPVCVFLDHGTTFEVIKHSIDLGFTGVMFDGSLLPIKENIRLTRQVKEYADKFGCSVEAEIGHVGGLENDEESHDESVYTQPEKAAEFVKQTNVDALAISIGNIHGLSKKPDRLHIELLEQIREQTGIPLVLHGGSGLPEDEIRAAIQNGIAKLNIWSEMPKAYDDANEESKGLSYCERMVKCNEAVRRIVTDKITLFGSAGRA